MNKVLSLFDGVSCARLALERAGFKGLEYCASEVDKYATKVTQANRPDTIQLGDVRNVKGVKDVWLLIGGSPCQDLSIAKKGRKGLSGERSGLFWEYVRILNETKPKYFILENVASMPKEAKEEISKVLGVEPVMINASLVSAQNRKRLFWVGKLDEFGIYNKIDIPQPEDKGILLKDILENGDTERLKSYCIDANYFKGSSWEHYKEKGNRQMIRVGQFNSGGQGDRVSSTEGKSVGLSTLGGGRGAKTGLYAVAQRGRYLVDGKRRDILGAKTEQRLEIGSSDKAHTITKVQKDSMIMKDFVVRKLTPTECERLQSMPDGWTNPTADISNTQRYKMCGNAFNVEVVAHILKFIK